jgi:hypothetical protein
MHEGEEAAMVRAARQRELRYHFVAIGDAEWAPKDAMTVAHWRQALAVTERFPAWCYAESQRRMAVKALQLAAGRGLGDDAVVGALTSLP